MVILDKEITTFLTRSLGEYSVVYLDARYEKVRHAGSIKSVAVLWAIGIDEAGKRQVLGLSCKLSEAETHWRGFLTDLVTIGLRGVRLIVSDAHQGLCKARETVFPTVPWQRCISHFMRNADAYIPRKATLTYFTFPRKLWKRIRTSNVVERFNRELRRRTRVVSIFPNEESATRLVAALLIEIHEEWINSSRYLDIETIHSLTPEEEIYRKKVA